MFHEYIDNFHPRKLHGMFTEVFNHIWSFWYPQLWFHLSAVYWYFYHKCVIFFKPWTNEADEVICASVWMFYLFNWDVVPMFSHSSFHPYLPALSYLPFTVLLLHNFSDRQQCPLQFLLYFQHLIYFGKQDYKGALLHIVPGTPWLRVQGRGFIHLLIIYSLQTEACSWELAWVEQLHVPTLWRENPRWKSKWNKLFMTYGSVSCRTGVSNTGNSGAFCSAPGSGGGPKLLLEDPGETGVFCML